jgi:hypothetical protein
MSTVRVMYLAIGCLFVVAQASAADNMALPDSPNENGKASVIATYVLPSTDISIINPNIDLGNPARAAEMGFAKRDLPGIGSALVVIPNKPDEYYMLTDRGPNFEYLEGGKEVGKIFPMPNFTPAIVHVKLQDGLIQVIKSIPIVDAVGKPVTGLTNDKKDEASYDKQGGSALPYKSSGLDAEALQLLPDGKFLVTEEYAPSVLVVDADGKVLMRYVPVGKAYKDVGYPIKPILPEILQKRRANRGLESLALTADAKTAFAILQSPMGDKKDNDYKEARAVRIVRLDVSDVLNAKVTGLYVVLQNDKGAYPGEDKQTALKYSDAVALSSNKLLLLERATNKVKLIEADLSQATNLLGTQLADNLKVEANSDQLDKIKIMPASTREVFDSMDVVFKLHTDKLEGLTVLNDAVVAMSNDNDFGVGEDNKNNFPTKVWFIRLGKSLSH